MCNSFGFRRLERFERLEQLERDERSEEMNVRRRRSISSGVRSAVSRERILGRSVAARCFRRRLRQIRDRVAIIDREQSVTYAQLNERSERLALSLLDEGLKPLDRVVMQLPNVVEFAYLYFALQKIGCIPIMALPSHRYREISQFVQLSGAVACATPDKTKDFDYRDRCPKNPRYEQDPPSGPYLRGNAERLFVVD